MRNNKMNNRFGNDFVTISDENGNDYVLEHLDTIEIGDRYYMAFLPTDVDEESEDYGIIILTVEEEDGEDILVSVDDDDLLEELYERFIERILDEEDE